MDYLPWKKNKKSKNTTDSLKEGKSQKEDDKIKKQIDKEIRKQEKLT